MAITPLPKTPNVDSSVSKSLWDWLIKMGVAVNQLIAKVNSTVSSGGDMLKSVYDTDNDGKVNSAVVADSATNASNVPWSGVSGKPSTFTPSTHKSTHATGGGDALTPADIGAAAATHTHSGSIMRVIGSSLLSGSTTSSQTFVDVTGASLSITPTSASNKIKVTITWTGYASNVTSANNYYQAQVLRGSTIISGTLQGRSPYGSGGVGWQGGMAFTFLDSPATTSAVTYKLQHLCTNASGTANSSNITFVLEEVVE